VMILTSSLLKLMLCQYRARWGSSGKKCAYKMRNCGE